MLQRSQTLYLLVVFILTLLMLTGPVALFMQQGTNYYLHHSGVLGPEGVKLEIVTWPLSVLLIVVATLAFLNIFFYRNRIRQMRICIFLILLLAGTVGMLFYFIIFTRNYLEGSQVLYQWRIVVPPVAIILLLMAFMRIRRDELLVKAYDRIR